MPDSPADPFSAPAAGYSAFISYSHQDAKTAAWLQSAIERYVVPKRLIGRETPMGRIPKRLGKCFRDRDELPASSDLKIEILKAIDNSRYLIVLCSPAAARSPWVNDEIIAFKQRRGAERVIAVITAGEPFARAPEEETECLPLALRVHLDDNGALTDRPAEPVAADLRPGKDGKRAVQLKVLAAMLGIGLDDLAQREAQRKQRVYGWLATGTALMSAAFGGLAIWAWQQRNIAVEANARAELRRTQAESLLEFMIEDLHERLKAVGRLDLLDSVAQQALTYFATLTPSEMDETAAGQRARVLTEIGELQMQRGQQAQALDVYNQAWQAAEVALAKSPNNPNHLYEYGRALQSLGFYYYNALDEKNALKYFQEALSYYERANSLKFNMIWRREESISNKNIGAIYFNNAEFEKSGNFFRKADETLLSLLEKDPDSQSTLSQYGDTLSWRADALRWVGEVEPSIQMRKRQISLYEQFLKSHPDNNEIKRLAITARHNLANIQADLAEYSDSFAALLDVEHDLLILTENDPKNLSMLSRLAAAEYDLTQVASLKSDAAAAAHHLTLANDLFARLQSRSDSNNKRLFTMGMVKIYSEALFNLKNNHPDEVVKNYDQEKVKPYFDSSDFYVRYYLAQYISTVIQSYKKVGQTAKAEELYHYLEEILGPTNGKNIVPIEAAHINALRALGRRENKTLTILVCSKTYKRNLDKDLCRDSSTL